MFLSVHLMTCPSPPLSGKKTQPCLYVSLFSACLESSCHNSSGPLTLRRDYSSVKIFFSWSFFSLLYCLNFIFFVDNVTCQPVDFFVILWTIDMSALVIYPFVDSLLHYDTLSSASVLYFYKKEHLYSYQRPLNLVAYCFNVHIVFCFVVFHIKHCSDQTVPLAIVQDHCLRSCDLSALLIEGITFLCLTPPVGSCGHRN